MYQLRMAYSHGHLPGDGEELAWNLLSELAGDVYVQPALPEHLRAVLTRLVVLAAAVVAVAIGA